MERTGKFATKEQIKKAVELLKAFQATPVISLTGRVEDCWSENAWKHLEQYCHQVALDMGFPEFEGFYGMDGSNGEILKPQAEGEEGE